MRTALCSLNLTHLSCFLVPVCWLQLQYVCDLAADEAESEGRLQDALNNLFGYPVHGGEEF